MILTGDYHTHTTYSHGKGSVFDNVKKAKEIGLKEIGITDHGFSHPAFGLNKRKLPKLREDVKMAEKEFGVKTYLGIESNLLSSQGDVDLKEKDYNKFDLFLVGVHKFVLYKPKAIFNMFIPNFFTSSFNGKPTKNLIKINTKAYVNAIKKHPIDVITHLNFCCFADVLEVAKASADYGTYIELNGKKKHLSKEELYLLSKENVNFIINSDAHSPKRVGEVSLVEELLKDGVIKEDKIANINGKTPEFRFKKYKEEKGI